MPHPPATSGFPLTPVQQGMFVHQLQSRHSGADIQQLVATVDAPIDVAAFRQAWTDVSGWHASLRTRFHWGVSPEPWQEVADDVLTRVEEHDLSTVPGIAQDEAIAVHLKADRTLGFQLGTGPLSRVTLFRLGPARHLWVWTFPHIILDGGSFAPIVADLYRAYDARLRGQPHALQQRPSFADYARWLTTTLDVQREDARAFFASTLRGFRARNMVLHRTAAAVPAPADRNLIEVAQALSVTTTTSLRELAADAGVTMNTLVQAAWSLVVSDFSGGDTDVVVGVVRRGRAATVPAADQILGMCINTVPLRVQIALAQPLVPWLQSVRHAHSALHPFGHTALLDVHAVADVPQGEPLFDSILVFNDTAFAAQLPQGGEWCARRFEWIEQTSYPLTLCASDGATLSLKLTADPAQVDHGVVVAMVERLVCTLHAFDTQRGDTLGALRRRPHSEQAPLVQWNATTTPVPVRLVHECFEAQVRIRPDAVALVHRHEQITYAALDARANFIAARLQDCGVGPDAMVGICMERGIAMVAALLGTLKAGGAYVPLDPGYPAARIAMMLEDCTPSVVLTQESLHGMLASTGIETLVLDGVAMRSGTRRSAVPCAATAANLAYMIFTSGSSGRPKGVMVEHRNVASFFIGMDERVGTVPGVWLAVTSIAFDISVLELLWTLGRGFKVVIQDDAGTATLSRQVAARSTRPLEFSLFYFAADAGTSAGGRYRLLLDGARYADAHGFGAVWTPERHFHAFGGLYPNPSVTSAAIAAITQHVQIRAGSIVLPLHDPIRVAEEWSVVDNLSNGRVGLSFASGWHANDFALAPQNYEARKAIMYAGMDTIRRLWRGESVTVANGVGAAIEVRTLPRPVQEAPPFWISAAGNTATFEMAGQLGANLLTNMLGQRVADLEARIASYRGARRAAGHAGEGHVSLMLHTFIGDDVETVKALVREPFMRYLKTSTDLVRQAQWEFPAFARAGADAGSADPAGMDALSADDEDALMAVAFERYFRTHGLFGTPDSCADMIETLKRIGVDEVACLIDFGVDDDTVLSSLDNLNRLRQSSNGPPVSTDDFSIATQLRTHGITHLQCTPSLAQLLLLDTANSDAFAALHCLLLGGEALPDVLADRLLPLLPSGRLLNMYGPTETTVWSTTALVRPNAAVTLGRPIANTQVYVIDRLGRIAPPGVLGELCIGGDGVVRGYHARPDLTADRFIVHEVLPGQPPARLYRTGDLARWRADGTLTFAGRLDHQVKVRGYRIELGEIEHALLANPDVRQAVVLARESTRGETGLVGYVSLRRPQDGMTASELAGPLRAHLATTVPDYMVPHDIIVLDALPLTPNGKIDRSMLPAPTRGAAPGTTGAEVALPSNELERRIGAILSGLLGHSQLGVHDNFFDLGANSLVLIRANNQLRAELGVPLSLVQMFEYPTIAALAGHLALTTSGTNRSTAGTGQDRAQARRDALARRQPTPRTSGR